jgi:hypothetical protein
MGYSDQVFSEIYYISPTIAFDKTLKSVFDDEEIIKITDEDDLIHLDSILSELIKSQKEKDEDERENILIILDDCCSDTNFHQSKSLKKLATRGRHIKISVMITAQYLFSVPPIFRNNCDSLLVGQMNTQGVQLLTTEFMMGDIDRKEFLDLYYSNTNDYGFLVINNNSSSDNSDLDSIYGSIKTPEKYIKKM